MSKRVLKYILPPPGGTALHYVPAPAFPVHVAFQHGQPTIWMEVPGDGHRINYMFYCFGTGHDIPDHLVNMGCLIDAEGFVWHYYRDGMV